MDNQPVAGGTSQEASTNTPSTIEHNVLMGILSYISILVLIPLLTEKNDSFVRFHVRQGLVLLVIEAAVWVLSMFMMWPLFSILRLINLACVVLSIIGIVNVINKKETPLPVVGQFASYFKV